jgi:superfamily II DNA or RNA helicase
MTATIVIEGADARLEGKFPKTPIVDATSYYKQGYKFMPRYKQGVWDGRIRLYNSFRNTFPSGLTHLVKEVLEDAGVRVSIDDRRSCPPLPPITKDITLNGVSFDYPYDFQLDCMEEMVTNQRGIAAVATNGGKCLSPSTPVLMYNGSIKLAIEIKPGDVLMGPDSQPRVVRNTVSGEDQMFRIIPNRYAEPFECNSCHVLVLYDHKTDSIIDVQLDEFLKWNKDRQRLARLVRAGTIEFSSYKSKPEIDPWFLGLWYAEGRKDLSFVEISNPDKEVENELYTIASTLGLQLKCYHREKRCPQWRLVTGRGKPNDLLTKLRSIVGDKISLPKRYLVGSVKERSEFLAGVIDGDGHSNGKRIEIVQAREQWAKDIAFVARSLGFGASITTKSVRLPGWKEPRTYWRVFIFGDTSDLPLRVLRKHAYPGKQGSRVGFKAKVLGRSKYCGFTLCESDGRFLLGDFTVTHNTEIAIATTACLRLPTLFMVPGKELLYQTQKRYAKRLGIDKSEVGLVGDGYWKPGQWITTAVVDSLFQNLKTDKGRELLGSTDVFFMDECHHAGADSWYKVARACPAYFRFGLSGTPLKRTDGADLRLLGATGPVLYEVRNKFLIERQISSEVEIQMLKMFYPKNIPERTPYPEVYKAGIVDNLHRNRALCVLAGQFAAKGLKVLMMVKEIRHGELLDKRLWSYQTGSFTTHQFIHGKEDTATRQQALQDFEDGTNQVLIATSILDEGVDIPSIDVLILCGGGKSSIKNMQRLGRGIRFGGTGKLIVVDVADFQHRYLLDHSLQRLSDYKGEDCFEIKQIKLAA